MARLPDDQEMPSPTPRYHAILGRAAEIARSLGTPAGAGPLFLALLHDGGWPLSAIAPWVDLAAAKDAVLRLIRSPDCAPLPPPPFAAGGGFGPAWGGDVAVARHDAHLGVEHALLAMIRARESVPARALASLADLDALEEAVLELIDVPPGPPADAVFLPEGQELDGSLHRAIVAALPERTTYGFSLGEDGRTWLDVFGPGTGRDPALTRRVLTAALGRLGRPALDG